jgi:superfamily I DNA and/or RNA helicase
MSNTSKINVKEANFIIGLLTILADKVGKSHDNLADKIGIITPYKSQSSLIRSMLKQKSAEIHLNTRDLEVNTVDAF